MILIKMYAQLRTYFWTWLVKSRCESYKGLVRANRKTIINKNVTLGNNVNFNGMIISNGGKVKIGDNFHSGAECRIIVQNHNYEGASIPYDSTYIKSSVIIEDNVWLGHRVIILGNVTIGEGAIIQAGSVVVSDIPKYSIAGGHPAKVFKQRNIEHYLHHKEQRNFQ